MCPCLFSGFVVFAAGNEQTIGVDVNTIGYHNSRFTIVVGATDKYGISTPYSNLGASVLLSAPGGDVTDFVTNTITAHPAGGCVSILHIYCQICLC